MFLSGDVNICEKCTISEDDSVAVQEVMTVTNINISESVSDSSVSAVNDISASAALTNSELLANTVSGTVGNIRETLVNEAMMREDAVNISANSTILHECAETGTSYAFGSSSESNSSTISECSTIYEISVNRANGIQYSVKRQPINRTDVAMNNVVNNVAPKMMESSTKGEFSDCQAFDGDYADGEDKTCIDNVGSEYNQNAVGLKDCRYWHDNDDGVRVACNNCMYNSNHCHLASSDRGTCISSSSKCRHSNHLESQMAVSGCGEPLKSLESFQLNSDSPTKRLCHCNCDCNNSCCSPDAAHDIIHHQTGREILDSSSSAVDMISTSSASSRTHVTMNSGFGQPVSAYTSEAANVGDVHVMKVSVHSY